MSQPNRQFAPPLRGGAADNNVRIYVGRGWDEKTFVSLFPPPSSYIWRHVWLGKKERNLLSPVNNGHTCERGGERRKGGWIKGRRRRQTFPPTFLFWLTSSSSFSPLLCAAAAAAGIGSLFIRQGRRGRRRRGGEKLGEEEWREQNARRERKGDEAWEIFAAASPLKNVPTCYLFSGKEGWEHLLEAALKEGRGGWITLKIFHGGRSTVKKSVLRCQLKDDLLFLGRVGWDGLRTIITDLKLNMVSQKSGQFLCFQMGSDVTIWFLFWGPNVSIFLLGSRRLYGSLIIRPVI